MDCSDAPLDASQRLCRYEFLPLEGAAAAWEALRDVRTTDGNSLDDHITVRGADPVRPTGGTACAEVLVYHRI